MTSSSRFVGIQPWLPGIFGRCRWLTEAVPAERAAALRIAAASMLLLDILIGYLPTFGTFFTAGELGGRELFDSRFRTGHFFWSILRWLPDSWGPTVLMAVWIAAAVALLVGWRPLVAGLVAWACAVSFWNINVGLNNSGDRVRNTLLLMVAVSSSGAVWGVQSVRRSRDEQVFVPGWPIQLIFLQLAVLYCISGIYKVMSPPWRDGTVMYCVNNDLAWCLCPAWLSRLPMPFHQSLAYVTLIWELGFPVLAVWSKTRTPTLLIGFFFHLSSFFTLEVGHFALYGMACYAGFVPWEQLTRWRQSHEPSANKEVLTAQPEMAAIS